MTKLNILQQVDLTVVSVIIPVYKDVLSLRDTAESVKKCELPSGIRLELIVVNDGGDPAISQYCRSIGVKEVLIRPNKGSYFARNRGIEFSVGQYLGFVDADIFVDSLWIANAVNHLAHCDYIAGNIRVIPDKVSSVVTRYQQLVDFNTAWHMQTLHYGPTANVWVKRSVIEQIGGFDERLFSGGDMDFGSRVYATEGLVQLYGDDVIVNHPPRDLKGLVNKSRRLAHGHSAIKGSRQLNDQFSFVGVIRRNLGKSGEKRRLDFNVGVLRLILFVHRTLYRMVYKFSGKSTEYDRAVIKEMPTVERYQH